MNHPADDDLERYPMRTLPVAESGLLEEHLLICAQCRERLDETEQYVAAIRVAASTMMADLFSNPLDSYKMTKQQLIEKVTAETELKKVDVEVAVDSVLGAIAEALRSNERVDLRGFGSFVVRERKERQGRNPRTGETITIAAKRDASFKPGKELTEKLAQAETTPTPEV